MHNAAGQLMEIRPQTMAGRPAALTGLRDILQLLLRSGRSRRCRTSSALARASTVYQPSTGSVFWIPVLAMACAPLLHAQTNPSMSPGKVLETVPVSALQQKAGSNAGDLAEFEAKAKARFQAARKGDVRIFLPESCKVGDTVTARVTIQRAPEGSDGLVIAQHTSGGGQASLLKVDDEMAVNLSAEEPAIVQIHAEDADSQIGIRHLLPGAQAEWIWHIKVLQPGEMHISIVSNVIYRRNFRSDEPPILQFNSSSQNIPIQVLP